MNATETGSASREDGQAGAPRRPHSDSLELGALDGAVPSARLHTRLVMREWGLEELAEVTELVVSELVTNAVRATRDAEADDPVRVSLLADEESVLVVVSDAVAGIPRPGQAAPDAESGRGLAVVKACSQWWDWKESRGGKLVRALVAA